MIKVGSDFSGVGAFNQALIRLGIKYKELFSCDMDKYARQTFIHNYGEPEYYPTNVYDREIPSESLDIYMTSPPCQAFSLAGKRLGKDDKRGVLFFNSHEFIQVNKPRFFIFENVKGLLSDDNGKTFQEWVNMLGGKSVNGVPVLFPYEDSVPYHLYWQVLNAKHHGIPQNRERVFLIGIRDDQDNVFQFPKEEPLTKRLKDVLQDNVDEKYFLSEKMVSQLINNGTDTDYLLPHKVANTLRCGGGGSLTEKHSFDMIKVIGNTNPSGNGMNGNVFDETGISPTLSTNKGEGIKIKSATSKGYEEATEGDSINFSVPNSETRRGRVGQQVTQTLDTACNQGVILPLFQYAKGSRDGRWVYDKNGISPCMLTGMGNGGGITPSIINNYKIRRLTPRECFRLMDFPDSFTWPVSDSQAYKQAGNSICVGVLAKLISKLRL
jgi:DNA (cytosine-5)-methyltransferase 1